VTSGKQYDTQFKDVATAVRLPDKVYVSEKRVTDSQTALPLEASQQIELPLTDSQADLFAGLTELQRLQRGSVVFAVLAGSYVPELGRGVVRLQCKLIGRKTAARAIKILRAAEAGE
jgi:hypothetical protein